MPPVIVELAAGEEIGSRPFAAAANTVADARVMGGMLARLRALAPGWLDQDLGEVLVREPDPDGYRHWIRVPDSAALFAAPDLTVVGFFGQARGTLDQTPIDELEAGIVETLETLVGVLCYYDLALPGGGYGNLILCAAPDAPANVHGHELHRRAVQLTPRHYHTVRLHNGVVAGAFLSDAELIIRRTRYYDYDSNPAWLGVRDFATQVSAGTF